MSMRISKKDGKRNKKALHAFPFSSELGTFYWFKADKTAYTLILLPITRMSVRAPEGICSKKISYRLACVAWRFWLGALTNKGGARAEKPRGDWGAPALLCPVRQNRHATQASYRLQLKDC